MVSHKQRTLAGTVSFSGTALHSGRTVHVDIKPARRGGIVFIRTDLENTPSIAATPVSVLDTTLATRLGTPHAAVATVEHLMAAFFGLGIDHAVVSVDGEELPILDGSSASFLTLLDEVGIEELSEFKQLRVITKNIEIIDAKDPQKFIRIEPSKEPLISYAVQFDLKAIGDQVLTIPWNAASFCEQSAFARTFCLEEEIAFMQSRGLARGGSLENAVVFSREKGVLNQQGLRDENECVRHKILDCIGDLYLLGTPILGHVMANKAGHDLHTRLAREIFIQTDASHLVALGDTEKHPALVAPHSLAELRISFESLALG